MNNKPPVKQGEELDVKIESLGGKGDGIAKVKGFVLFVKGVEKGETCRVRVSKVLEKVGFADKIGVALAEPKRERMPEPEPEPQFQDSEDFGSDLEDSD